MIKILHVEDETDILEIAKMSFEIHGNMEVTMCSSGREALQVVESFTPDIILLDYMMPELSGPETLKKLRQLPGLENVPAVFMTARAHEDEHQELWDLGASDVISKPFDPMALGSRLEATLRKTA
jgi:DNA-binding response OmpR family regulator